MQRERGVGWLVAVGVVLACPAGAAAATPDGSAEIALAGKASERLAAANVRITAGAPADATAGRIRLPVRGVRIAASARLDHAGTLRLRKGKRAVTLRRLRTTLGDDSRLTALVGDRRIRFAVLAPARSRPLTLDAGAGLAAGRGIRATLTPAAARMLRRALKAKRLRAGRLGTVEANGRLVADTPPRPADPPAPAPQPAPSPQPAHDIGHTDWVASTLTGSMNLKTFTNYLLTNWPAVPPAMESGPGTVVASGGATRIDPANPYDHRLEIHAAEREPDGAVRITHAGRVDYRLPAHSIDNRIADPEVVIAPGGASAKVYADGHATSMSSAGAPPVPFTDEHVLDLDLSGIPSEVGADGTRTWHDVPAVISATGQEELGYGPGSAWGAWTITVPAADTDPAPAAVSGASSFAMRPSWVTYITTSPPPPGSIAVAGGTTETTSGVFAAPVTGSADLAALRGSADLTGSVRYLKAAHGIDITVADTRVELGGAASKLSAVVTKNGVAHGRVPLATLDLSAPAVTEDAVAWTDVPAALTAEGSGIFTYPAGDPYGTLSLSLDRP